MFVVQTYNIYIHDRTCQVVQISVFLMVALQDINDCGLSHTIPETIVLVQTLVKLTHPREN